MLRPRPTKPEPYPFDTVKFPYGKLAGSNKFSCVECPTCGRDPTHPTAFEYGNSPIPSEGFHMFRNEISAREYYISGMCQSCQDLVFGSD